MTGRAQDIFAALLKERIAPALRTRGFRGSGQIFRLPDDRCFIDVGFQKSMRSDAAKVAFTINLSVVDRAAWRQAHLEHPWLPETPSPNTRFGEPQWVRRAGQVMPERRDTWWTVDQDTDLDDLATRIIDAFDKWLLPALRAQAGAAT